MDVTSGGGPPNIFKLWREKRDLRERAKGGETCGIREEEEETLSSLSVSLLDISRSEVNGGFTTEPQCDSVLTSMSILEGELDLEQSSDYFEDAISEDDLGSFHSCYFDKSCSDLNEMSTLGVSSNFLYFTFGSM